MTQDTIGSTAPYLIEKDIGIPVNDGILLRANIYRPAQAGRFSAILAMGIYGKDVHFADAFAPQWGVLQQRYPDLFRVGSSGEHVCWEMADPDRWVPDDYALVNIDSRGSGKSPGFLDPFSPRETQDYYDVIEWTAQQPWCNGKVGLLGVSYLAIKQWQVAALQPPHLAAMIPWEGASDLYRDWSRHGGILSNSFIAGWWPRQVLSNQHGNGETHYRDRATGESTTGAPLSSELLRGNRAEHPDDVRNHPFDDAWYQERTPDLQRIVTPFLSAANWGGPGVHLRGNIEAFTGAAATEKWLSVHVGTHYESFYLHDYVAMQKQFFGYYLKGEDNGWERRSRVRLEIRSPDRIAIRYENEWPLAGTRWTKFYLDAATRTLATSPPATAAISYDALGEGVSFMLPPLVAPLEITGPVTLRLWMASSTVDADVFVVLRAFAPDGEEVIFTGAHEPTPVARGWLRASHRACDPLRSTPWRPFHAHMAAEQLSPGDIYPLDIEIWPTCLALPPGYRLALTLQGRDFLVSGAGRIQHDDPDDRDPTIFGGRHTIHTGGGHASYLLLPVIPDERSIEQGENGHGGQQDRR
jgi:predicted acyl esterase